jgi:hypothetical protein
MPPFASKAAKRRDSRMVDEKDENAQLMAQLRFTSGQVNMLMDLCLTFISANSSAADLVERFEATVRATLAHTDLKLISQEFVDGELDIVNRVRHDVISALPRNPNRRKEIPLLLEAPANVDRLAPSKLSTFHSLEALTTEWTEKALELKRNRSLSLSITPSDVD